MKTKTSVLLSILFCIGLTTLSGQKSSNDNEYTMLGEPSPFTDKMNGKVQKVVLKFYWGVGNGENIKKGIPVSTRERDSLNWNYDFDATFDSKGDHMISLNYLDDNYNPVNKYQFVKENDRIALAKWTMGKDIVGQLNFPKGNGYTKYIYDKKGQLIRKEDYKEEGDLLLYTFPFKNNEAGDPVESQALDSKGNLLFKWSNTYNEKRQDVGGNWTDKDGNIAGYYKAVYNDKGKIVENTMYDKDKNVIAVYKFTYPEYDARGNWLKFIINMKDPSERPVICERTIEYF